MPELLTFKTRLQGGPVWEMVEFLLNGVVFTLIGLQLPEVLHELSSHDSSLRELIWYALLMSLAVIPYPHAVGLPVRLFAAAAV